MTGDIFLALKDTFSGKVLKFVWGSSISSVVAALLLFKSILGWSSKDSIKVAIIILLCAFILRFFLNLIRVFGVKAWDKFQGQKFQDSIVNQKLVFSTIHSAKRNVSNNIKNISSLVKTCDAIKIMFETKTKSNCSVSIKLLAKDNLYTQNLAEVKNICRDSKSKEKRDKKKYDEIKHYITANTPFQTIVTRVLVNNKKQYYINNSIPNTTEYYNSSKSVWDDGLPYKSELVVPLMPLEADDNSKNDYKIKGFLCVDSSNEYRFDEKFDPPLIQSIAEDIYDYLESWDIYSTEARSAKA